MRKTANRRKLYYTNARPHESVQTMNAICELSETVSHIPLCDFPEREILAEMKDQWDNWWFGPFAITRIYSIMKTETTWKMVLIDELGRWTSMKNFYESHRCEITFSMVGVHLNPASPRIFEKLTRDFHSLIKCYFL